MRDLKYGKGYRYVNIFIIEIKNEVNTLKTLLETQGLHWIAWWLWASYSDLLRLSFFICKMQVKIISILWKVVWIHFKKNGFNVIRRSGSFRRPQRKICTFLVYSILVAAGFPWLLAVSIQCLFPFFSLVKYPSVSFW